MTASRATRRTAVLLALCAGASTGLLALPAHAASTSVSVTLATVSQNWWWAEAQPAVDGTALPVGTPADASGIPMGSLGVGYTGDPDGKPDKVAALAFDLGDVPLDSVFSTFLVKVPLDPAANQVANGHPAVSACENIDTFIDGPGAQDISRAPAISAPSCIAGTFDAKVGKAGGYVFALTSFANDWSGGAPSDGITLRPTKPATGNPEPFSLSFSGKNAVDVSASYTAPAVVAPVAAPPAAGGSGTAPSTGGSTPQLAPAPALGSVSSLPGTSGLPSVPGPLTAPALPVPVTGVAPQVAAPSVTAPSVQALSLRRVAIFGSLRPSTALWLGALAVLALLGLTALSLGDPMAPAPADPRRRRFAEVVGGRTAAARPAIQRRPAPPRSRFSSIRPA